MNVALAEDTQKNLRYSMLLLFHSTLLTPALGKTGLWDQRGSLEQGRQCQPWESIWKYGLKSVGGDGLLPQTVMKQTDAIARTILIIFGWLWQLGDIFATYKIKNVILIISCMWLGVILQFHTHVEHLQKHKGQKKWSVVSAYIYEEEDSLKKSDSLHEMKSWSCFTWLY